MLQPSTLKFLKDLKKNNNKPWFEKNKSLYLAAKDDFESFIKKLIPETGSKLDPAIGKLQVKDCVFRIYRDVRFSKDKTPYKSNMGASLNMGGKKIHSAGYYFHCEPGQSFIAGGFYMPMPPDLARIRQEIDYNFPEWKKIVENKSFKKFFTKGVEGVELLSRPPKGYDENNPAISYLKMKSFIVSHPVSNEVLVSKLLLKECIQSFTAMKPMNDFLNAAIK
jgi:uncharacterized protein (TIGR02453 family)